MLLLCFAVDCVQLKVNTGGLRSLIFCQINLLILATIRDIYDFLLQSILPLRLYWIAMPLSRDFICLCMYWWFDALIIVLPLGPVFVYAAFENRGWVSYIWRDISWRFWCDILYCCMLQNLNLDCCCGVWLCVYVCGLGGWVVERGGVSVLPFI